jgi:hypothetical protein
VRCRGNGGGDDKHAHTFTKTRTHTRERDRERERARKREGIKDKTQGERDAEIFRRGVVAHVGFISDDWD